MTRHTLACDHDGAHPGLDCATATELARLRAFAEAVRDEFTCLGPLEARVADDHTDDCLHCAAEQALERVK